MSLVVGVQFSDSEKLQYFDPEDLKLEAGDYVVAAVGGTEVVGQVVLAPREVAVTAMVEELPRILRKADRKEQQAPECEVPRDTEREREAMRICEQKIRMRSMPMKLIDAEFARDGSKLIFYFAADGRVDFRELVRDLASVFRTRIELRQIGVRDEAKKIGGLGPCGRPCCCNQFLEDFTPVSIRMAKEQSLSLSPTKISGLCGRLMCCLHYEHEHYREMHKRLPRLGAFVETPDGPAEVVDVDALLGRVRGRITLADGNQETHLYALEDVKTCRHAVRPRHAQASPEDDDGARRPGPPGPRKERPERREGRPAAHKKRTPRPHPGGASDGSSAQT